MLLCGPNNREGSLNPGGHLAAGRVDRQSEGEVPLILGSAVVELGEGPVAPRELLFAEAE